ncbi:MAG: PD-(D/E)XK nuclease family protein [Gemmatimonadetes bacterium]|nr:PD-(D/E)XK nuclease family protein [Gemmatimonadota bacterium]
MEEQLGFEFATPREPSVDAPVGPALAPVEPALALGDAEGGPRLLFSLAAVAERYPRERKLVVGRTRGEAHELLRQLALRRAPWIGFEVTTVRPLALEVAGWALAERKLTPLDEFEEQALLDAAIDQVLLPNPPARFARLVDSIGFRDALQQSVRTLRLVGIGPDRVRRATVADPDKLSIVAAILAEYEAHLHSDGKADHATVLATALEELRDARRDGHRDILADRRIFLLPGLHLRGLAGRFVHLLVEHGAKTLETDPVEGLDVPTSLLWRAGAPETRLAFLHAPAGAPGPPDGTIQLFAAAGIADELREALRRVVAAGRRWDEVEIVAADPQAYGSALHALAEQLGIPVTFAVGLPVERTRPGRTVASYFRWLDGGFGADVFRQLLETGDLRPDRGGASGLPGAALARRFRSLRIGWGRERYLPAIDRQLEAVRKEGAERETPGKPDGRRDRKLRELEALRSILAPVLKHAPPVSERLDDDRLPVSPADVARGLSVFLRFVPALNEVDRTAKERIERILKRIATTLVRQTEYGAAAAVVRSHLHIRVPAPQAEGKAPWSSAGGHLHLTDLEHGGVTGRPITFLTGLDADCFPGGRLLDPLLLDADRRALAGDDLPTSADRLAERQFQLAALLARLRGTVTLSYSAWSPSESRQIAPAAVMLDAFRLSRVNPSLTFEDLHRELRPLATMVPRGSGRLDDQDVWLGALERDGRLLAGRPVVRTAFPSLDAGLRARDALAEDMGNAFHGVIRPRPDELDPRRNAARSLSASALQTLGTCPRRYLFNRILRIKLPDDPVLDPDSWLDARERGRLLHRVFERILRKRASEGELDTAEGESRALDILDEEAALKVREIPAPSRAIMYRQAEELKEDVKSFLEMTRSIHAPLELELKFGLEGDDSLLISLPGGTIGICGAVDRVDGRKRGLTVVDYKTGVPHDHRPADGVFHGGRRLQHVVYSEAVERLLKRPVEAMEYHFPTLRGENQSFAYERKSYASGLDLIATLLDGVGRGHFLPTENVDDCKFCDYRAICRVRSKRSGGDSSSLLDWAAAHWERADEYAALRSARTWERVS